MKRNLFAAVFSVVGASASGVGAVTFATQPYVGDDLLYNVTNQAILSSGLGNTSLPTGMPPTWDPAANPLGDYSGGGSSFGEDAMVLSHQGTAPMARFLEGHRGACAATNLSNASGIVLGISGTTVVASNAVISAHQVACNGALADSACTPDGAGLVYSGGPFGFTNWRDVLALLYGGLDRSNGTINCAPTNPDGTTSKRAVLVANWPDLFQNAACTNPDGTALTHAWRPDDASGIADVFSSIIGLQTAHVDAFGNTTQAYPVSASALHGFGTSPFCNAMNWDPTEVTNKVCGTNGNVHYVGPGGFALPASVESTRMHHVPPPGAYGSVSAGTQPSVFPTSYQDNDPIRGACAGTGTAGRAAEDVCNSDGKLGVVLPVPSLNFMRLHSPPLRLYPSTVSCNGGFVAATAPQVRSCAPRFAATVSGQCPNNDVATGIGCFAPVGPGTSGPTSQCQATNAQLPFCFSGACGSDGRVYNLQGYDGTGTDGVKYLTVSFADSPTTPNTLSFTGAFARIHQREVSPGGLYPCQLSDTADQIGCLVQADPRSIGFGGATSWEGADPLAATDGSARTAPNTAGVRVNQLGAGAACTPAAPGSPSYPLWNKVYVSSIAGFAAAPTAEIELAEWESEATNVNAILARYGVFSLPFSPTNNAPFCEDFNEKLVCGAANNTQNACNTNVGLTSVFGTIPADPSSNPALATVSTVCGNGVIEPYEDCDPSVALPAGCGTCSSSCRCSNF
jgi:hypothetical protein